jgi:hypothetical protein
MDLYYQIKEGPTFPNNSYEDVDHQCAQWILTNIHRLHIQAVLRFGRHLSQEDKKKHLELVSLFNYYLNENKLFNFL